MVILINSFVHQVVPNIYSQHSGTKAHCLLREKEELKKEEENESSEMEKENEPPSQMEREDKLLPSVPLKKRKRVVKQKLQKVGPCIAT